ncbi:MAG: hypothetical protein ACTHN5_20190 [Phycisphaerae bacterium]
MANEEEDVKSRLATLEARVESLESQLERAQSEAAVARSLEQINRGEGIPARDALESLRQKYNIPVR